MQPIVDESSVGLILGTMPSTISLSLQEYYANPLNQFWKIIYTIFDSRSEFQIRPMYKEKIRFLKQRKIALWDVLEECERYNSEDAEIKNPTSNDFVRLFAEHPNIRYVYFNGQKAEKLFSRSNGHLRFDRLEFFSLPSTSPAYASMSIENKVRLWSIIRSNSERSDP